MRSASATEVPPNFITTVSAADGMAAKDSRRPVRRATLAGRRRAGRRRARGAGPRRPRVAGVVDRRRAGRARPAPPTRPPAPGRGRRADLVPRADRPAAGAARAGARADRPAQRGGPACARLPLERKVAQLFLLGFQGTDLSAEIFRRLRRLDLGGVVIERRNYTRPAQLGQLAGEARVIARRAGTCRRA